MKGREADIAPLSKINTKTIQWEKMKTLIIVYIVMVLLIIVAQILRPGFASFGHLENVARQSAFLGLVCIGQTLIILTGGIDLSVAQMLVLSNIIAAQMMSGKDENTLVALLTILLIGAVSGFICGVGVYYLKIPSMVMTLAMGNVLLGVAYIYSKGSPKGYRSEILDAFTNGRILGLTYGPTLLWIVLAVIIILVLRYTAFGRSIYLIGTNREAARYSGVKIAAVTIAVYTIQAVLTALTGFILVGYTGTGYMSTGAAYGTSSIAAVVIGGASVLGGKGGYGGTVAGVIIMTVIISLMTMLDMPEAGRLMAQGAIIIALLLIVYRKHKQ
jgi:ribose transport system permease protein